ncbi:hypothetical protein GCM10009552_37150 [Rothia nasimurium]
MRATGCREIANVRAIPVARKARSYKGGLVSGFEMSLAHTTSVGPEGPVRLLISHPFPQPLRAAGHAGG